MSQASGPLLSLLLLPGDDAGRAAATDSFAAQGEGPWELVPVPAAGDLAAALTTAAGRAGGRYVGVLGSGDRLEPGALAAVVAFVDRLGREPAALYTDESGPAGVFSKPRWVPAYLEATNYLGRLLLVRRDVLAEVGGWRSGGAMEWDLALRLTERTEDVAHVPVTGLIRAAGDDLAVLTAGREAVAERYARLGVPASVELTGTAEGDAPGFLRVWREVPEPPLVSILVPTAGGRREIEGHERLLVTQLLRSLVERTTYERWEVVLVTSEGTSPKVLAECEEILGDRLTLAPVAGPFNFSRSVNTGAAAARGELLLLLNDDIVVLEPRWLERMVAVAQDPQVGAVGAKLLFGDGRIQHVGVSFDRDGEATHPHIFEAEDAGHFGSKVVDRDYEAVTGACLLTPRDLFVEVGGLTEALPLNYNDVDYCLKVRGAGRRVVCTPFARLRHYESSSRTARIEDEERAALAWWRPRTMSDPYTNVRGLA
ncbi:glycosyltransferase [Georgenia sp. 311]|uniref:Glycosyltransferase n=1 Tax=Georgenia wutianyii TaxID=2585135 RepID=A0ABX5VM95_9MICO|nr:MULTISPECIES: glycosyltransferase [Georgenia]QDB78473.1 glycosyltransferase [Georgenia wutianyii]TNC16516.1 glycosyltransferase [Georgenia sp. 311]